ncbi:MAG: phosphopentomutase [Acidobacteria bacterium]|nr:phosphopentomutase [Acidobacteriota bacterium]
MTQPFGLVAVIVCDSVGCGNAPDADDFGDLGANTIGHVVERTGARLPELARLGAESIPGVPRLTDRPVGATHGARGRMFSRSPAKDTMVGHWELMGVVADQAFPTFPNGFPAEVIRDFGQRSGRGVLGNKPASGTEILVELGARHVESGDLIVYTSGDSVFQIAAHTDIVPLDELYRICGDAREMLTGSLGVGRVIARPFDGPPGNFERRASDRRDYALTPVRPTALDHLRSAGIETHAVGKIQDIFGGQGISTYEKSRNNSDGIERTVAALRTRRAPCIFTNLVDFDSSFGHRNDPVGYGRALEEFDSRLPELLSALPDDGLLLITADHGNDPTWPGTDHTREAVPIIAAGRNVAAGNLGDRACFGDLAATILDNFEIAEPVEGESFLAALTGSDSAGD